ncbi:MAG: hypothetical protein QOJ70_1102 [Acidobacteriota bacterium]|jgi:hypothetical protein|nr:hypothetical protein [Acidobacteriota bacterium]
MGCRRESFNMGYRIPTADLLFFLVTFCDIGATIISAADNI